MRLASSLILLSCLPLAAGRLAAQVRYTDVQPDSTVVALESLIWASFEADVDRDGRTDYFIVHHNTRVSSNYAKVEMQCAHADAEFLCDATPGQYPLALAAGTMIGAPLAVWTQSLTWSIPLNDNASDGHWIGVVDKCAAVRIRSGGAWRYGWIRMDVPSDASGFTVKDYAIELTPGRAILAGDRGATGAAPPPVPGMRIGISPHPVAGRALVRLPAGEGDWSITIRDLGGKAAATLVSPRAGAFVLDGSALPAGLYLLEAQSGRERLWQRFICRGAP